MARLRNVASIYLSGILSAWSATLLGLGVFFAAAYLARRRERDLLVYAAMCLALAYHSASSARAQVALSISARFEAVTGVMEAALLTAALNLHFVLLFVDRPLRRITWLAGYALVVPLEIAIATGHWWRLETAVLVESHVFGAVLRHWRAEPTAIAVAGFALVALALCAAQLLLVQAARAGKREAWLAAFGGGVLVLAALNDMLLSTGAVQNTLFLVPHAFMLYAASVASTLVVRYRKTIVELTHTETELRRTSRELFLSHEELRSVQRELTAKEQLAAVGELAAAIAHEVRNPLAVINNAVAGLRRPQVADPDRDILLSIVTEETERLNQLVTDLLRFARPTSLQRTRVDLVELLQKTQVPLKEQHALQVRADDSARFVQADANLLRAAFDNLIQNAAEAMPSGGDIEVNIERENDGGEGDVVVVITDHGTGMDASTLARARDPFFTTRPSGTGLGLPIVERVVEAHGGELSIESALTKGTTVRVRLPDGEPVAPG